MSRLLTMQEIRATTEIYPSNIDIFQADKEAINSWFDTRYVCDNEKFVLFFKRVLVRDYGLYRQLLRNEPDISKYDWLVQQYNESQTYEKGSEQGETNATGTATGTATTNGTATHNNTNSTVINANGTHTHNGTDTDTGNGTSNTVNGGIDTTNRNSTESHSETTETNASGTDTVTDNAHTNTKSLNRENPMSISYAGGASIDGNNNTGALDWQYPSGQNEQDTRNRDTTTTDYGRTDETETGGNSSTSGTESTSHGHTVNVTDSHTNTKTITATDTDIKQDTHTGTDAGTETNTTTATNSNSTTSTTGTVNNKQHITQHVNTGRSVDTATLLSQAQAYIMNSSAFQWLYSRLDVCFMGVYNDSENDYI